MCPLSSGYWDFYTKCADLSTVYTFTQSRHLHSSTNSAFSSALCLLTKCNDPSTPLTHSRYFLSANKVRRSVYTFTQRRHLIAYYSSALSSSGRIYKVVNCRDDLIVNPLCLHWCLIRLHYNFCSFKGLNIQIITTSTTSYGLYRCISIGSSTPSYFYALLRQVSTY
jgi:hypothetical protein